MDKTPCESWYGAGAVQRVFLIDLPLNSPANSTVEIAGLGFGRDSTTRFGGSGGVSGQTGSGVSLGWRRNMIARQAIRPFRRSSGYVKRRTNSQ